MCLGGNHLLVALKEIQRYTERIVGLNHRPPRLKATILTIDQVMEQLGTSGPSQWSIDVAGSH